MVLEIKRSPGIVLALYSCSGVPDSQRLLWRKVLELVLLSLLLCSAVQGHSQETSSPHRRRRR